MTSQRLKRQLIWLLAAIYLALIIVLTIVTVRNFSRATFGLLFIAIALWPAGRFFLAENRGLSRWLDRLSSRFFPGS